MKISERLFKVMRNDWEGLTIEAEDDGAGYPTIGIGHKMTISELTSGKIYLAGVAIKYAPYITVPQAEALYYQDMSFFEAVVRNQVKVPLEQHQFDILCSFAFNVGAQAFVESTLLKKLNNSEYQEVPNQLKRWIYSKGKVMKGLVNRRKKEIGYWRRG